MNWHDWILAAPKEDNEPNNLMKILAPLVLMLFYGLSHLINTQKKKEKETPAPPRQPSAPAPPPRQSSPPQPAARRPSVNLPTQPTVRHPMPPVKPQPPRTAPQRPQSTMPRPSAPLPQPGAKPAPNTAAGQIKKPNTVVTAAGRMAVKTATQAAVKAAAQQLKVPLDAAQTPAAAKPAAVSTVIAAKPSGLHKVQSLRSELARAVVYSEILGPPIALKSQQGSIPALQF